jgi:iron(II)-dependent oxidoreductase
MRKVWVCLMVAVSLPSLAANAAETLEKNPKTEAVNADNRLGEMITVPAGSFLMGNNGKEPFTFRQEFPQHSVYLPTYEIGKYEVTRGEYRRFMEAGGYQDSRYWSPEGWNWKEKVERTQPLMWAAEQEWAGHGFGPHRFTQTDKHPVVGVTYYEAEAYCKWAGGRLPTEAEWEKAARWTGTYPNAFPWGDTWDPEKCNNLWDTNPAGGGLNKLQSAPVGSYPDGVSPYGCMDMVGNAYEWVADWYKSYPGAKRPFDETNKKRVARGGCWDDRDNVCRCGSRGWPFAPHTEGPNPDKDCDFIGIRVVR